MIGLEFGESDLKHTKTNLEVYKTHSPQNFSEAFSEFTQYCERQLPEVSEIVFSPICFCITSQEDSLVLGGLYGNIANYDIISNSIVREEDLCYRIPILEVVLVLNDTQVIAHNDNFEVFFLEFPTFEVLYKLVFDTGPISLKLNSRRNFLFCVNEKPYLKKISLYSDLDYYEKTVLEKSIQFDFNAICLEISENCALMAIGLSSGQISLIHLDTEKHLKSTDPCSQKPMLIKFNSSSDFFAASFENFQIEVWKISNELILQYKFEKHREKVTGLAFVKDDTYLVSSSHDSSVNVWNLCVDSAEYSMNYLDGKILEMKCLGDHSTVFYIQESNAVVKWKVPSLPKTSRYSGHSDLICKLIFIPNTFDLVSFGRDGFGIVWDYRNHLKQAFFYFGAEIVNGIISKNKDLAVVLTSNCFINKWNLTNNTSEPFKISCPGTCLCFDRNELLLAVGDEFNRITIYDFESTEKKYLIKGHTDQITVCLFLENSNVIVSASLDKSVGKWDLDTGERLGTCKGHESAVKSLVISVDTWILSGDELGIVMIWNMDCLLLYTVCSPDETPITSLYISMDHKYLITLQNTEASYWQLENLSLMFQLNSLHNACTLALTCDEKAIAFNNQNIICVEENPLASTYLRIVGKKIGTPHKFMKFVIDCQKENPKSAYDMHFNHWMITPYLFNANHILAFSNRFDELNNGLFASHNKSNFFSTINNENPLSICIDMEYKNCIDICLKYIRNEYSGKGRRGQNLRAFVPLESCLTRLNEIEYPYIYKLYDAMFIEVIDANLPRFCLIETALPALYISDHLKIYPSEIIPNEFYAPTGRPIVFSQSLFPLDIDLGTNGSIKFLQSLLKCSDQEIFRTAIVKEYLRYKWTKVKPMVYVTGFTYVLYLILLGTYILLFLDSKAFLSILIFVHLLLFFYEVLQIATDFSEYAMNSWNILDQLRSLSFSYYAIMAWEGHYNTDILLAVLIFSWTRGIACFRMFDETRYMVRLIIQVIIDITTFFFILFYATLAFAFVFYLRNPNKQPFAMYLTQAYRLDLGDFDTHIEGTFDWLIFFVSTMINPLIMLNLLIAIMSDTATFVAEIDDICGLKELAEMIIDIEKVMFWKKLMKKKHYLHKCDFVEVEEIETNKTMLKLKFIKKQVSHMSDTIKNIQDNAQKINDMNVDSMIEKVVKAQNGFKQEMESGFAVTQNLLSGINRKLMH